MAGPRRLQFLCANEECSAPLEMPRRARLKAGFTVGGIAGGAAIGAYTGTSIGVASGGTAAAATVPLGVMGGAILGLSGYVVGDHFPVRARCGACGALNVLGRKHIFLWDTDDEGNDLASDGEDPVSSAEAPPAAEATAEQRPIPKPPATRPPKEQAVHREMASSAFRTLQWDQRFDDHIAPVNGLVDELRAEAGEWAPYVAPHHGGTKAHILLLLQAPGPGTDDVSSDGSGFLSVENDDPTAQLMAQCLDRARVSQSEVIPWNAYPWVPHEGRITAAMVRKGLDPLVRLLGTIDDLVVVMPMGKVANDSWALLAKEHPELAGRYEVIPSLMSSPGGITGGYKHTKREGVLRIVGDLGAAKDAITRARWGPSPTECPSCGSSDLIPIKRGMPTKAAGDAAERGEIILGGCIVHEGQSTALCRACGESIQPVRNF
jgi:hypothetical protein